MSATFTPEDHAYMAHALRLAARGLNSVHPNPRVGCVIVRDGQIVGEGWHSIAGGPHAEVLALKQAGDKARDATAYVTLEPCCHHGKTGPCSDVLVSAGVGRVVAAMPDPNPQVAGGGFTALRNARIDVAFGLMAAEAAALNPGFVKRMRTGRPYVRCKLALTLDGKTAAADGESQWLTGEAARADVQQWRIRSDAILTGINTVIADDPALTVREEQAGWSAPTNVPWRQPRRVVLDSRLRFPPDARMLRLPGETWLVTLSEDAARLQLLADSGAHVVQGTADGERIALGDLIDWFGRQPVNEVWVEAGPTLSGALLEQGLVDEFILYVAPQLLGGGRDAFFTQTMRQLSQRVMLTIKDIRAVGADWRIIAVPKTAG